MAMMAEGEDSTVFLPEIIDRTCSINPPGICTMESSLTRTDLGRDQVLIAAYLKDCADTETLQGILKAIDLIMVQYASICSPDPQGQAESRSADLEVPDVFSLLEFLQSSEANQSLLNIFIAKEDIDFSSIDVAQMLQLSNGDEKCKAMGHIMAISTLVKIVNLVPFHFCHTLEHDVSKENGLPDTEDLHRAYCVLRLWLQLRREGVLSTRIQIAIRASNISEEYNATSSSGSQDVSNAEEPVIDYHIPVPAPGEFQELIHEGAPEVVESALRGSTMGHVDFTAAERWLPLLTSAEKASLVACAKEHLIVRRDPQGGIGVADPVDANQAKTGYPLITYGQDTVFTEGDEQPEAENTGILDNESMPMIPLHEAATMLGLDATRPVLFSQHNSELLLYPHQVTGVAVMLQKERDAFSAAARNEPSQKMGILADDMGLGKTIQVLALVYFTYSLGIQSAGSKVQLYKPTLVAIPPAAALGWYKDYVKYFFGKLKVYFVGPSFRDTSYQAHCIQYGQFKLAVDNPSKSTLYQNDCDPGRTIFIMSHFMVAKYTTAEEQTEATAKAIEDRGEVPFDSATKTGSVRKQVEDANPTGNRRFAQRYVWQQHTYTSLFAESFHRVVIDDGHLLRYPGSNISRAIKLLEPSSWWVVTATPLLNKTFDMRGYCHLFYNRKWELHVSKEFTALSTLQKFDTAKTPHEILTLFDPSRLRDLAVNNQIDARWAARSILILLRQCMIRRTLASKKNREGTGPEIPASRNNGITLAFNQAEQEEYCKYYCDYASFTLAVAVRNSEDEEDAGLHSGRLKNYMAMAFAPRLGYLYERDKLIITHNKNLQSLALKPFHGIEAFLKSISRNSHVPQTRESRVLELLSLSPSLRYIAQLINRIVDTNKERLMIFVQSPAVGWLITMFCLNWGVRTAWLRAGASQEQRDQIISDFNNPSGQAQIFTSTHKIAGFGINFQPSGCRNMVVAELPRNLNSFLQTCGRLTRIGQTSEVQVWTLFTDHTFQRWWSANLARKALSNISMQLRGSPSAKEKLDSQKIGQQAREILKRIMDWDEDRSAWIDMTCLDLGRSTLSKPLQSKYTYIDDEAEKSKESDAKKRKTAAEDHSRNPNAKKIRRNP